MIYLDYLPENDDNIFHFFLPRVFFLSEGLSQIQFLSAVRFLRRIFKETLELVKCDSRMSQKTHILNLWLKSNVWQLRVVLSGCPLGQMDDETWQRKSLSLWNGKHQITIKHQIPVRIQQASGSIMRASPNKTGGWISWAKSIFFKDQPHEPLYREFHWCAEWQLIKGLGVKFNHHPNDWR